MAQKPSLPKGTRDFGPAQMLKRDYILNTIRSVFKKYGFMPLETPAIENLSVLTGKYGDEGDQLLFRILNTGDFLKKTSAGDYEEGAKALSPKIAEKGLKYDLTVPFARYVVMNRGEITFPFKRYQIQPVWRADRPQKGRYREFYQCDADVVGTGSLICEAELMAIVNEVYTQLNFNDYKVSISSRKVLEGLAALCEVSDKFTAFCVILDKLDKIGEERVAEELSTIGVSSQNLEKLKELLNTTGSNQEKLGTFREAFVNSEVGLAGLDELSETFEHLKGLKVTTDQIIFDPTLARGLSYYTGIIYEVKPTSISMGTITAGGRYDNLTGVFGMEGVSGVGISFGIDRIYDSLEELNLFPETNSDITQILITNFDKESEAHALGILAKLRSKNIKAEIFPEAAKLKKQLNYANNKGIAHVLMVGSREIESGEYVLKNMETGDQQTATIDALANLLS
ncbi:histidyl-tRNA synthetase [Roseivirga pacifica]|uniref:Histidine--tRNA ligase n=1 Tax=Roseivirga pacifica TaxID=1267423 RepID=A0A1I0RBN1_9BACT|nr:histidine--tRNA ligase [Roseivirga pacifica]RKQ49347.1 histidyl-tRNA synthetase [Roseivirga pacifica]SEW38182.1 histidyl-tRNA synthetase [Roseivirga pacifica]